MRSVVGIVLLLLGVGLLSCQFEGQSASVTTTAQADWVRTVDGWERGNDWSLSHTPPPSLHPLVVAAGQVLVSMFALAAATGTARGTSRR